MSLVFDLRPAGKPDFDFCWAIYRDAMRPLVEDWQEADQHRVIAAAMADSGSSILRSTEADAGWLHVEENRQIILLKQFCILPAMRNKGIGTAFLNWMKERADRKRKDLNVEVLSNSPARRLFERLDFKAVPGSGRTVTLRY